MHSTGMKLDQQQLGAPVCHPDYAGGSTLNLLAGIIRARGGKSPHPDLRILPATELAAFRKIMLVCVDGLGAHQLTAHLASGKGRRFFAAHAWQTITTVFPATTAAAVTTLTTGASPAEHGLTGWFVHLPDLGVVSTILRGSSRLKMPLVAPDFPLAVYLGIPSHLNSARGRRWGLIYDHLAETRVSRAGTRWTRTGSFTTLRGLEQRAVDFARQSAPGMAYVYWPDYDGFCHHKGLGHRSAVRHLEQIDAMLARLAHKVAGTGTLLLVVADHGLVTIPQERFINVQAIPGFYDCLSVVPSGDPRQLHCYVRPRQEKRFLQLVREHLPAAVLCVTGEALVRQGLFGPGVPHPSLSGRVGDYVLLARENYALQADVFGVPSKRNCAQHGGLSAAEMCVPLFAIADGQSAFPKK